MLKIHYNFGNISFIPQIFDSDVGSQIFKNFSKMNSPKGRFQKTTKKWLDLSIRACWLGSAGGQNPTKTNIVLKIKNKDDQNGLIHSEN